MPAAGRPTRTIYLVRHGQSVWNARGLLQGQRADVPLTSAGRAQAERAAAELADSGATTVLSSDLLRAVQTAEPIARRLGVPVQLRTGLREQSVGVYEGRSSREVMAQTEPAAWGTASWQPEGGESIATVAARLRPVLAEATGLGSTVLVTHGDAARLAAGLLRGYAVEQIPWLALTNGEVLALPVG